MIKRPIKRNKINKKDMASKKAQKILRIRDVALYLAAKTDVDKPKTTT